MEHLDREVSGPIDNAGAEADAATVLIVGDVRAGEHGAVMFR